MKIVNSTPNVLKDKLKSAISTTVSKYIKEKELFNTHFSRNRVLTMNSVINLLLSMNGGSLKKEVYDAGISATASAFVQQRNKFSWRFWKMYWNTLILCVKIRKPLKAIVFLQ